MTFISHGKFVRGPQGFLRKQVDGIDISIIHLYFILSLRAFHTI